MRGCSLLHIGSAAEASEDNPSHVETWGDPEGTGVEDPSTDPQGEHGHEGD